MQEALRKRIEAAGQAHLLAHYDAADAAAQSGKSVDLPVANAAPADYNTIMQSGQAGAVRFSGIPPGKKTAVSSVQGACRELTDRKGLF